jgi:hypothetical protein
MVGTFDAMTAVEGITKVVSGVTVKDCPAVTVREALGTEVAVGLEVGDAKIRVVAVGTYASKELAVVETCVCAEFQSDHVSDCVVEAEDSWATVVEAEVELPTLSESVAVGLGRSVLPSEVLLPKVGIACEAPDVSVEEGPGTCSVVETDGFEVLLSLSTATTDVCDVAGEGTSLVVVPVTDAVVPTTTGTEVSIVTGPKEDTEVGDAPNPVSVVNVTGPIEAEATVEGDPTSV